MKTVSKFIFSVMSIWLFTGCGSDGNVSIKIEKSELMSRSALLSSLEYFLLAKIEDVQKIYDEHNQTYEVACDNGGMITYDFSENLFPATMTYDSCSNNVADANITQVFKNGTLSFAENDVNVSVTFEGDFNHTVVSGNAEKIETIVQSGSTLNKHYNINDQGIFLSNLMMTCNTIALKTENVLAFWSSGISPSKGKVFFGNEMLYVGRYGSGAPSSVSFDEAGNIDGYYILYERGSRFWEIIAHSEPNSFSLSDEQMDVTPYLWR